MLEGLTGEKELREWLDRYGFSIYRKRYKNTLFQSIKYENDEKCKDILGFFEFLKKDLDKIEPWFYKLIEDEDEKVRKRALEFYKKLREPKGII